jgi:hypothetical protein
MNPWCNDGLPNHVEAVANKPISADRIKLLAILYAVRPAAQTPDR